MKHIVTVTTSNPAHEHVSLRRRQSTTNYMVEARNEDEALLRATAHFRGLGHYIHEAKIFKKKDEQLIEGAAALKRPFNKETNIGSVVPGSSKNVGTATQQVASNQYFDVTTGKTVTRTTQNDIEWEKEKRDAHTRNLMATDKPIEPLFPELDILGGVTRAGASILSMIRGAAVPRPSRTPRRTPRRTPARPPSRPQRRRPSVPTPNPQEKPVKTPKKPGEVVPFPTKPAPAPAPVPPAKPGPAPAPAPAPVTLPPAKPSTPAPAPLPPAKPAPAPQPKPAPAPAPQPGKSPSPQPVPVPKKSPVGKTPSSPPVTRPSPIAGPKSDPRQLPAPRGGPPRGGKPRRPFALPRLRLGDRPDQDIGTLGQYRGMFPLYQFADFNSLQENQVKPMNAIGRVMTKRKEKSKENAEAEKNKINMEPTLKSEKN